MTAHDAIAAHPEPEPAAGPSAQELRNLWGACNSPSVFALAVLARWGDQPPRPIPLSERLPTEADCDQLGRCWLISSLSQGRWNLDHFTPDWFYTHWLPHHALPLPSGE